MVICNEGGETTRVSQVDSHISQIEIVSLNFIGIGLSQHECFNDGMIFSQRHLRLVLAQYQAHYNGRGLCVPNPIQGSDQQSCPSGAPAVMITHHVPEVRLPVDHAGAGWSASGREKTRKTAEILILRHQLTGLQRRQPRRPRLNWADRVGLDYWIWLGQPTGLGSSLSDLLGRLLLVRRLLGCLMVPARGDVSKDAELLVLRHENAMLRRTQPGPLPAGRRAVACGAVPADPDLRLAATAGPQDTVIGLAQSHGIFHADRSICARVGFCLVSSAHLLDHVP